MSKLYDAVHAALVGGARTTEEIVNECRRAGHTCRPETIELFLHLAQEIVEHEGAWGGKRGSKHDRIMTGLQKAFAGGQAYVPMDRLSEFLDEGEPISGDDISAVCEEGEPYRVQGKLILRVH